MNLEELNNKADSLTARLKGINNWIEENEKTDPNFYEMVDCMVEYGTLASQYDLYFQHVGYPTIIKDEEETEATHYDLTTIASKLREAQMEEAKMWSLRNSSPFFNDDVVRDFVTELSMRSQIAEYNIPKDKEIEALKKQILAKTAGIYFYIWQTKQNEPEYQYDNVEEWKGLQDAYNIYKDAVGVEFMYRGVNYEEYEGPQFGMQLEKMFKEIEKNYKFSEEKESNLRVNK